VKPALRATLKLQITNVLFTQKIYAKPSTPTPMLVPLASTGSSSPHLIALNILPATALRSKLLPIIAILVLSNITRRLRALLYRQIVFL
jgi:hypothetical protein